ncbi:MAG: hypothetical protein JJE25_08925, partial [Bacteroidia bacterium]|nr:hypothetical protein [Bacteroidia bacterium]
TWVEESVRENPERREYFFDLYKAELDTRKFRYEIVSGQDKARTNNAVGHIEKYFGLYFRIHFDAVKCVI